VSQLHIRRDSPRPAPTMLSKPHEQVLYLPIGVPVRLGRYAEVEGYWRMRLWRMNGAMRVVVFVERDMWICYSLLCVISETLQRRTETYLVQRRDKTLVESAPKLAGTEGGRDSVRRCVHSAVRELLL
jgi:hypothetical protein